MSGGLYQAQSVAGCAAGRAAACAVIAEGGSVTAALEEVSEFAGTGVLASAGVVVNVTVAAMAAAKVSTARDILTFIEGRVPFLGS